MLGIKEEATMVGLAERVLKTFNSWVKDSIADIIGQLDFL